MSRTRRSYRERILARPGIRVVCSTLLSTLWSLGGCGSPTDGPPGVSRVVVTSPVTRLVIGDTARLVARLEDASGNVLTGRAVAWSTSNATLASVSTVGLVSGRAAGPVTITATSEGRTGTASLTVVDPCVETSPIAIGETVSGALASTDCRFPDGSYADRWLLMVTATSGVEIGLESTAFDAFLAVTTLDGTIIALDDDGGGNQNALAEVILAPGSYVVWANSFGPGETGPYTLSMTSTVVAGCSTVGTIAMGETVTGALTTTDCLLYDDTYADGWTFTVAGTTAIIAELASTEFDAFVIITDAQGNRLGFHDDIVLGVVTDSRLRLTLDAGTYRVWANSFAAGETGSYSLSLRVDSCQNAPRLDVGGTATGSLTSDDCRLSDGSYADRWALTLSSATTVRLDLASDAFDAYLFVTDAANNVIAGDDDSGAGENAQIEVALPAGSYIVWANSYAPGQTGAYTLAAASVTGAALNLRIDGTYVTQSIQRFNGTVPLVKNRSAYVRVFGRANIANAATPAVRVRIYNSGTLRETLTIPAAASSVPTLLGEGIRDYSWNVVVDGSHVQPGLGIAAEIDPNGAIPESDETDNSYPADGTPRTVDVREISRFDLTVVPIHQSANGLVGDVNPGNPGSLADFTRRVFPLDSVDVVARAPYTTTLPALQSDDANGSWPRLLAELDALRVAEGSTRTYYGVVKVAYARGVAGIGYVGRPTAFGWDFPATASPFMAHELGHTFGRFHSPCGGAGGVDPNYPYPDAAIGWFGYDRASGTIIPRTAPDLMSYCDDQWVSDYTYEGVLSFRAAQSRVSSGTQLAGPVLLVWGTVEPGNVVLEPAFHIVGKPSIPSKPGPWSLVGRDAENQVVFSYRFGLDEIADAKRPTASFAFALPADSAVASRIHSLRLIGPAGEARVGLDAGVRHEPARAALPAVTERVGDRLSVRWDDRAFPLGLVRDTRTGVILSIVRGGRTSMPTRGPGLELLLSDGVRTTRQRLDDQ
jgi:hypothetical protein